MKLYSILYSEFLYGFAYEEFYIRFYRRPKSSFDETQEFKQPKSGYAKFYPEQK